jgi:hypothetical protein
MRTGSPVSSKSADTIYVNSLPVTLGLRAAAPHRRARGERRDQGRARSSVHSAAHVARHDAPPIGERTATRGRSATGGGDERALASRTGSSGRNRRRPARPTDARTPKPIHGAYFLAASRRYPRNGTQNPALQHPVWRHLRQNARRDQ